MILGPQELIIKCLLETADNSLATLKVPFCNYSSVWFLHAFGKSFLDTSQETNESRQMFAFVFGVGVAIALLKIMGSPVALLMKWECTARVRGQGMQCWCHHLSQTLGSPSPNKDRNLCHQIAAQ